MIEIRPIQPCEIEEAKLLVFKVAHETFKETLTLEDSITLYSAKGVLNEMNDVQKNYFNNGGTFLVTVKGGQIIGTGAIRFLEEGVCELKRMWLLPEHHGQGLGYRMIRELFSVAKSKGYNFMRLQTEAAVQTRAIAFYKKLGFYEISRYEGNDPEDMAMEVAL
jgi:putative acetyltransferase